MNIIKFNYNLWKHWRLNHMKVKAEKHLTKMFFLRLDEAIEKCKKHPRKYYIIQKDLKDYEILSSVDVKKMKKFKIVRQDETFIDLDEKTFVVHPGNIDRLIEEQKRRKWYARWWNTFFGQPYKPLTKFELEMLTQVQRTIFASPEFLDAFDKATLETLNNIINNHKQ